MSGMLRIALVTILLLASLGPTVLADTPQTVDVVSDFYEFTIVSTGPPAVIVMGGVNGQLAGTLAIQQNASGMHLTAHWSVPGGNAYTVWWIDCADGAAFPCPQDQVLGIGRAAGHVVHNGKFNFGANVPQGTDELRVIRHGAPIPGIIDDQIHVPIAGCADVAGPNTCAVAFVALP